MLFGMSKKPVELPTAETAIPDRAYPNQFCREHFVNGNLSKNLCRSISESSIWLGVLLGSRASFLELPGVFSTAVGYAGGLTKNPSYEDVCSGRTGIPRLFWFSTIQAYLHEQLLAAFWEAHDPTQGMRQGNDLGTQYRSAIYWTDSQQCDQATASLAHFQQALRGKSLGNITTEVRELSDFYYAEDYHQQYLAKNPGGYCGLAGTGVCYAPSSDASCLSSKLAEDRRKVSR